MGRTVICYDSDKKEYSVNSNLMTFRPAVYGLIIRDGMILLSKQHDGYDFPGGGQNLGETIGEALARECWEETGFKVKSRSLFSIEESFYYFRKRNLYSHCIGLYYFADIVEGERSVFNCDPEEVPYIGLPEWIHLERLRELKFYNLIDMPSFLDKLFLNLKNNGLNKLT